MVSVNVQKVALREKGLQSCVRFKRAVSVKHEEDFVATFLFLEYEVGEILDEVSSRVWISFAFCLEVAVFSDICASQRRCLDGSVASAVSSDQGELGS